jgi:anti-repressor protein
MWIQRAIERYDFKENEDYNTIVTDTKSGKRDFIVSIDMAKELCLVSNTLKGKETRKYFIEVEKQNSFQVPQNFHEALLLAADLEKQNQTLLIENKKQSQFITNVVHNNNTYTATQVAKDLNISAKLFNKILVEAGVIFFNNGTYALVSRYQNHGLTELKESEPNRDNKTYLSLRWTSKGKNWIKNNFEKALHKCSEQSFNDYNMQILSNLPSIPNSRIKRF